MYLSEWGITGSDDIQKWRHDLKEQKRLLNQMMWKKVYTLIVLYLQFIRLSKEVNLSCSSLYQSIWEEIMEYLYCIVHVTLKYSV